MPSLLSIELRPDVCLLFSVVLGCAAVLRCCFARNSHTSLPSFSSRSSMLHNRLLRFPFPLSCFPFALLSWSSAIVCATSHLRSIIEGRTSSILYFVLRFLSCVLCLSLLCALCCKYLSLCCFSPHGNALCTFVLSSPQNFFVSSTKNTHTHHTRAGTLATFRVGAIGGMLTCLWVPNLNRLSESVCVRCCVLLALLVF